MKYKSKNIIVFIIMAIFMYSFVPVNATTTNSGSITIHKYQVESLKTLGNSAGTGEQVDEANIPADAKSIKNVRYTVEQLLSIDGKYDIDSEANPNFVVQERITNSKGIATFSNLPLGVYRVKEIMPKGYTSLTNEFLVSVPMQTEEGKENYNVHVYPKSSSEDRLQKERITVSEVAGIGDKVSWKVSFIVNDDISRKTTDGTIEYAKDFFITDTLDERLDYQHKTAKLVPYDGNGSVLKNISLKEGIDYLETYDNHTIKWLYTDLGVKKLADLDVRYVEATIDTKINKKALGTIQMIANGANIEYINASGDPYRFELIENGQILESDKSIPRVYLGRIIIDVFDKDTKKKLSGAKYILVNSEQLAQIKKNFMYDVDNTPMVVTDQNGYAVFTALPHGTYYLIEIQEPNGYLKEIKEIEVSIGNTKNKGTVTVSILKQQKGQDSFSLIQTGDNQQIIVWLTLGAISLTFLVLYLLFWRKKNKE